MRSHLTGIPVEHGIRLLHRYGTHATAVAASLRADAADRPLAALPRFTTGELRHIAREEAVGHLADVLLRRPSSAFRGEATPEVLEEIAEAISEVMGWDATARRDEIEQALEALDAAVPASV